MIITHRMYRMEITIVCFFSLFFDYLFATAVTPIIAKILYKDTDVFLVGVLFGCKPVVQFICQPVISPLVDLGGSYQPLILSSFILILSNIIFLFGEDSYVMMFLGRFLQGVGSSFVLTAGTILISMHWPNSDRSKAISIAMAGLTLGTLLGPVYGGFLYDTIGYINIFFSLLMFLIMILILQIHIYWISDEYPIDEIEPTAIYDERLKSYNGEILSNFNVMYENKINNDKKIGRSISSNSFAETSSYQSNENNDNNNINNRNKNNKNKNNIKKNSPQLSKLSSAHPSSNDLENMNNNTESISKPKYQPMFHFHIWLVAGCCILSNCLLSYLEPVFFLWIFDTTSISTSIVGLMWSTCGLSYTITAYFSNNLSEIYSPTLIMTTSLIIMGFIFPFYNMFSNIILIILFLIIIGAMMGIIEISATTLQHQLLEGTSFAFSLTDMYFTFGLSLGAVFCTFLSSHISSLIVAVGLSLIVIGWGLIGLFYQIYGNKNITGVRYQEYRPVLPNEPDEYGYFQELSETKYKNNNNNNNNTDDDEEEEEEDDEDDEDEDERNNNIPKFNFHYDEMNNDDDDIIQDMNDI